MDIPVIELRARLEARASCTRRARAPAAIAATFGAGDHETACSHRAFS